MIILDTNVLSELMKAAPDARVARWVGAQPALGLCTTSITQAEILHGIELLPAGRRRSNLLSAAKRMFEEDLGRRVLAFDSDAATHYATLAAKRSRVGRPISHFDAQIASIAVANGATIATRNVGDFRDTGVGLVDPWQSQ